MAEKSNQKVQQAESNPSASPDKVASSEQSAGPPGTEEPKAERPKNPPIAGEDVATRVAAPESSAVATSVPHGNTSPTPPAAKDVPSAEMTEPNIEQGKTPAEENGKENQVVHTRSVSIKGVLKASPRQVPVKEDEIAEDDQVKKVEQAQGDIEITEAQLQEAWGAYAQSIEKTKPRVYSTLMQTVPKMNETGKILIQLNSQSQRENFVQNIRPGVTRYLQENLANIEYVFETNLIGSEVTVKKVYTDHDKLDYLIEKNPALEELKNRFNLDFDH